MCPECQAAAEILEYWNCGVFDFEEAHKRFRKEAKKNCAEAQFHLGIFYRDGLAVPKDEVEAAKLDSQGRPRSKILRKLNSI